MDRVGLRAGVAAVGVLVYAGVFLGLRRLPMPRYAPAHGLVAAVLGAYALSELVVLGLGVVALGWTRGPRLRRLHRSGLVAGWFGWWAHELLPLPQGATYLLLVAGLSAAGLVALARQSDDVLFRVAGHAAFAVLAAVLRIRWMDLDPGTTPVLGLRPFAELGVLGLGLAASHGPRRPPGSAPVSRRRARRLAGLLGPRAPPGRKRPGLRLPGLGPHGGGLARGWGLAAARGRKQAGLATLALFVDKRFLIDLATLPALWRIALFLGAGGGFLLVSYALPGLGDGAPPGTPT